MDRYFEYSYSGGSIDRNIDNLKGKCLKQLNIKVFGSENIGIGEYRMFDMTDIQSLRRYDM